jgi:hypothetical protein
MSKKRGHGEGTIFRSKKGGWTAMLDMGIVEGKRKRKAFYGADEKEVRAKLRAAQHLQDTGKLARSGRLTVGDWAGPLAPGFCEADNPPGYLQALCPGGAAIPHASSWSHRAGAALSVRCEGNAQREVGHPEPSLALSPARSAPNSSPRGHAGRADPYQRCRAGGAATRTRDGQALPWREGPS